jgi:hypothetical protein
MAGGIRSDYVMCEFPDGTSWKFGNKEAAKTTPTAAGTNEGVISEEKKSLSNKKTGSNKSPMAYVKEAVAKYFELPIVTPEKMLKAMVRTKNLKYEGEDRKTVSLATNMGATGASRSMTVMFKKLTNIGGKSVASVKVAMPASYTVGDMVKLLMARPTTAANIAQLVSPSGKTIRFGNRYKKSRTSGARR